VVRLVGGQRLKAESTDCQEEAFHRLMVLDGVQVQLARSMQIPSLHLHQKTLTGKLEEVFKIALPDPPNN